MKSKEPSGWKEYLKVYQKELGIGFFATLSTFTAIVLTHLYTENDDMRLCNTAETTNPTITNPEQLLDGFRKAIGEYIRINELKSGGYEYKSDSPHIGDVFRSVGSASHLIDTRKPNVARLSDAVCKTENSMVITYHVTENGMLTAEALIEAGVGEQRLDKLVN